MPQGRTSTQNFHTQKITEFLLIQDRNSLNGRIL